MRGGSHLRPVAIATALIVGLVVAGCGTDGPSAGGQGGALYRANCAACHGADLSGSSRGPSLLDPSYLLAEFPDASIADAVRNGVESGGDYGPMEAIPRLDDAQIAAIVGHIRVAQGVTP